jgi:translation initiation factor 5B
VKAALGVKIFAPGLEKAIAGARLYVAENEDEESYFGDICMDDLQTLKRFAVDAKGKGVYVQASTLGALEALLTFLQSNKVPIHDFGVGPVFAKTIRGHHMMAERAPEYACILAFDVSIDPEATKAAAAAGLKIFTGTSLFLPIHTYYRLMIQLLSFTTSSTLSRNISPKSSRLVNAMPWIPRSGQSDYRLFKHSPCVIQLS